MVQTSFTMVSRLHMKDLEFLADDHTLLSSQVVHVVALLNAFEGGQFPLARLHTEILRQSEILRNQLAEHFAFEEVTAFPHLEEHFPAYKAELRGVLAQHDSVLVAFEYFWSALNEDPNQLKRAELIARGQAFEQEFERHATEETSLLRELQQAVDRVPGDLPSEP